MGLPTFFEVSGFEDGVVRDFEALGDLDLDFGIRASARSTGLDVEPEPVALALA